MTPEGWRQTDDEDYAIVGPDGCHYDSWLDAFTSGILGFCGCGMPDRIAEQVFRYLSDAHGNDFDFPSWPGEGNDDVWLWAAYTCDRAELADHGSSVYGAWLTDKGREWREVLRSCLAEETT